MAAENELKMREDFRGRWLWPRVWFSHCTSVPFALFPDAMALDLFRRKLSEGDLSQIQGSTETRH
jgi:hypothetical protein